MGKILNICFFTDDFKGGGVGRAVSIIMNELHKDERYNCTALCYAGSFKKDIFPLHNSIKKTYLYSDSVTMRNAVLHHHLVTMVSDYLKDNRIDLIIACGAQFYPVAILAGKRRRIKVWCWEHTNPRIKGEYKFQGASRIFGAILSDLNIVLTKAGLDIYKKRFPQKNNIQIYNPIDPILLNNNTFYDINSKKIISVGRLRPEKNFDILLDVAKEVFLKHKDWSWDIYGEGELKESLEKKARRLMISDKVTFKGFSSSLYELYPEYSIMVMTSKYEGFPMTLLEGASNALPLVSFDIETGPNEIIADNINGFLIEKGNIELMALRICELIENDMLRINMSKESIAAAKKFSIEGIVSQWKQQIEKIRE